MIYPWFEQALEQIKITKANDKVPHALLITGEKKIGKQEFAKLVIKELLADEDISKSIDADTPNDKGDKELLIRRSNYQNLIYCHKELNKTAKFSVDIRINQIRTFCETLEKTADELKIGLLYYADDMNIGANNSLLKTLEEPKKNTLIILLAHKIENVPITIRSRCQHIHIPASYSQDTISWLKNINNELDVENLLKRAYGIPLQVKEWLEDGTLIKQQQYQERWLEIVNNPSEIINTEVFTNNELDALLSLQNILINIIKQQSNDLEVFFKVLNKSNKKHLFYLLNDIARIISLFETQANKSLLFNSIVIIWSHITHLQTYPQIFNKQ